MPQSSNSSHTDAVDALRRELSEVRVRLSEAQDTIDAIRNGEVDAVVVGGAGGHQVYTLENADRPYRVLIEQMQEGAVTLNGAGVVLYCNSRLAAMLSVPQERIIGGAFDRFVPSGDHASFAGLLSGCSEDERRGEFTLMAAAGVMIPVHLSFAALPGGEEPIWCGVVTDLTQQRRRSNELADANARLVAEIAERENTEAKLRQAQKMEAVGQLTGGIAHDFNNLLMIISGNLELAQRSPTADERTLTLVRHAMGAAERGAQLTKQLLAFSRRQNLQPETLNVNTLLPALISLVDRAVGATVTLSVVEAPDLWHCRIDPHQFESAMLNLAINARDAMPGGGRLVIETENVTLDAQAAASLADACAGRYVAVSVGDTGLGMDADTVAHAFEPFFTTKDVGKGSGLGLSMIYGFVRQSGGFVALRSAPGQGTRVTLHLPWAEAQQPAAAPVPPPELARGGGQGSVLVVEDDGDVRRLVVHLVGTLGYTVVEADSGPAALRAIENGLDADLLFSDVVMPLGMSGIELAHEVRRRRPGMAILLTSGFTAEERVRDPALEVDFPILHKPYRHEELDGAIRHALAARQAGPTPKGPSGPVPDGPATADGPGPSRPRILLVEDEALVAMAVEGMLGDLDCEVVGPAATLDEAIVLARAERIDGAILDVSLGGTSSYPVADILLSRGVAVVFASGYGAAHPQRFDALPTLTKPYGFSQLSQAVANLRPSPPSRPADRTV